MAAAYGRDDRRRVVKPRSCCLCAREGDSRLRPCASPVRARFSATIHPAGSDVCFTCKRDGIAVEVDS